MARAFLLSIEMGKNVVEDFLAYAYGLTTEAELEEGNVVPDDVWEQAAATFDWDSYGA